MGLISKLFNRTEVKYEKTIFAINIALWKRPMFSRIYKNANVVYIPLSKNAFDYRHFVNESKSSEILIWGCGKECKELFEFAKKYTLNIIRVEDGFLRSLGLGIDHVLPGSLCFDKEGLYYNAREKSDFENLANNYKNILSESTISKAKELREIFCKENITKYGFSKTEIYKYPPKSKRRVLVIGQVEGDKSIEFSNSLICTNLDLVVYAKKNNPDSEIVFKQHPDNIKNNISITELSKLCDIVINKNVSLKELFFEVDAVYTISSLLGFEALIRGISVYCTGLPFYAGWGLTTDSTKNDRRTAKLNIDELFAISYLVYPTYYDEEYNQIPAINYINKFITDLSNNKSTVLSNKIEKIDDDKKLDENFSNNDTVKTDDLLERAIKLLSVKNSFELKQSFNQDKPIILYIEWISSQILPLVESITTDAFLFLAFNLSDNLTNDDRKFLGKFSKVEPVIFKNFIRSRLFAIKDKICGMVFTFDWAPITRLIVEVCHELGIYTILIPHESIYIDANKYYCHPNTFASCPVCDEILVWGNLQKQIFSSRGYPIERISVVGSPKLDNCLSYHAQLSHDQFCKFYGLYPEKHIVLFACQSLDIQIDEGLAAKAQNEVICDLISFCNLHNTQLILRLPPSGKQVIFKSTLILVNNSKARVVVDGSPYYLTSPSESICHASLVVSLNSTMLLESVLMKTPALSVRYVSGINSLWTENLVPVANNQNELYSKIRNCLSSDFELSQLGRDELASLASDLGVGTFDGQASLRIKNRLENIALKRNCFPQLSTLQHFFNKERIDVMSIPSSSKVFKTSQKFLQELLNCNSLISSVGKYEKDLSAVNLFCQWGVAENEAKARQKSIAMNLGKDLIYIEDGFIRSIDIGLSGTPSLSIICDDLSAYYDATKPTRLESILNSDFKLNSEQLDYVKKIINKILEFKVSKYNTAKLRNYQIGRPGYKKLLLIDQRYGDYSVIKGFGSQSVFEQMLTDAINNYPDYDVIIKQHPDALLGGKQSYFSNENLKFPTGTNNIFIVNQDMNPYCLFSSVDEVFVCSSSMGFEALLAGKSVTCYGIPWYAGYGLTIDKQIVTRRSVKRALEELFYVSYIYLSRYYSPDLNSICSIEDTINYIINNR